MHWFWRATIAFFVGWVLRLVLGFFIGLVYSVMGRGLAAIQLIFMISYSIELAATLAVYGLLTRRYYQPRLADPKTRCRQCGYNLTGNTSGVCPECGQQV